MDKNLETYSSQNVVSYYKKYETLQKPEETILRLIQADLHNKDFLDIGIGGGRTTIHFAPLVKTYTGIDYSAGMVNECISRFEGKFSNAIFLKEDARTLTSFQDNSFDIIFFSFNGIDYIAPEEREKVFLRAKQLLRKGGFFCFSTHNINSLINMPYFEFRLNIPAAIKRIFEVIKIKKINKKQLASALTADCITINDGAHNYGLETCYTRTSFQIKQLENAGFSGIKIFGLSTGEELKNTDQIKSSSEKWLYYFCLKN
jgi:SAM-dependent methyltransferase